MNDEDQYHVSLDAMRDDGAIDDDNSTIDDVFISALEAECTNEGDVL